VEVLDLLVRSVYERKRMGEGEEGGGRGRGEGGRVGIH